MDYVGLAAGWTGELKVRPMALHDLARLREAFAIWQESGWFPPDYTEQLDRLEQTLRRWPADTRLNVDVRAEPEGEVSIERTEQPVDARVTPG